MSRCTLPDFFSAWSASLASRRSPTVNPASLHACRNCLMSRLRLIAGPNHSLAKARERRLQQLGGKRVRGHSATSRLPFQALIDLAANSNCASLHALPGPLWDIRLSLPSATIRDQLVSEISVGSQVSNAPPCEVDSGESFLYVCIGAFGHVGHLPQLID